MKILTQLQAQLVDELWAEPRGVLTAVCHEPAPGFIVQVRLGEGGLMIEHGAARVGIRLADLLGLAATHEPALKPLPAEESQPATPA